MSLSLLFRRPARATEKTTSAGRRTGRAARKPTRLRPTLELLDERLLLATITVNTSADLVADEGACSLREAVTAANLNLPSGVMPGECAAGDDVNDTIIVPPDTYPLLFGQLVIIADVTVSGGGAASTIIDGGGTDRVFTIQVGTVLISDLTVSNGLATSGGGIFNFASGTLTIQNSTITNNRAVAAGGGIFNAGSVTLTNSRVTNNEVSGVGDAQGGGIASVGGFVSVENGSLVGFNLLRAGFGGSAAQGGGIYASSASLTVSDSSVQDNSVASDYGGDAQGGGIWTDSAVSITGSNVSDNAAYGGFSMSPTGGAAQGGGIFNSAGGVTVSSSAVNGNLAAGGDSFADGGLAQGGGIWSAGDVSVTADSQVSGNTARAGDGSLGNGGDAYGGGMFAYGGAVTVEDSTVDSNEAVGGAGDYGGGGAYGGGIAATGAVSIKNSSVSDNAAYGGFSNGAGGDARGGGIFNSAGGVTLSSSNVDRNRAQGGDTAGSFDYGGDASGGGIWSAGDVLVSGTSSVSDNSAIGGDEVNDYGGGIGGNASGGAIFDYGGAVTVEDSTVDSNKAIGGAGDYGGGDAQGGGIWSNDAVAVTGSSVSGNTAYGGAATSFFASGDDGRGGGIYNDSRNGSVAVTGSTINDNLAHGGSSLSDYGGDAEGGGIASEYGGVTISGSGVSNNRAIGGDGDFGGDAYGGGVFLDYGGLSVTGTSTISGNQAVAGFGDYGGGDAKGGGIYHDGSTATVLNDSAVTSNAARGGAADYGGGGNAFGGGLWTDVGATITNSDVSNNTAAGGNGDNGGDARGGGIWSDYGGVTLANSTVNDNRAIGGAAEYGGGSARGGGIFVEYGGVTVSSGSSVLRNEARGGTGDYGGNARGGGIHHGDSFTPTTVSDSTVSNNRAVGGDGDYGGLARGGGIFSLGPIDVTRSSVSDNAAYGGAGLTGSGDAAYGGGIYHSSFEHDVTVTDSMVDGNRAVGGDGDYGGDAFGGGIYFNSFGTLAIANGSVSNNTARSGDGDYGGATGGGIWSNGVTQLSGGTIAFNDVIGGFEASGGGIYHDGFDLSVTGATLNNNRAIDDVIPARGGGIFQTDGSATITDSTIADNEADQGGGIFNDSADLTIDSSDLTGNIARRDGGAIFDYGGTSEITDSDISGNTASGSGGGIFNAGFATITDSTITGNMANMFDTLDYSFGATPFEALDLVPGDPGVTSILTDVDDDSVAVDLGADSFNFYGTPYAGSTALFVSSNGLITFAQGNSSFGNSDLSFTPKQAAIASFWDDLFTGADAADQVLYKFEDTDGDLVNDRLIIEWNDINLCCSASPSTATFQAILQLNSGVTPGSIIFNYPDVVFGDPSHDSGASATVGLKNKGVQGPERTLVSFDSPSPFVGNGLAILFTAAPASFGGDGGGVYVDAVSSVMLTDSTVSGNSAARDGGGIHADLGMATIERSSVSGNNAGAAGGGIAVGTDSVIIINSTVSGNVATGPGGGIHVATGGLSLTNATLNANGAAAGGDIFNDAGDVTLVNTIVAGSTGGGNFAGAGMFTSLGHNLSSDATGAAFLTAAGDLNNTDPLLGPLQNNGGPTLTHALLTGGPAIDAGDNLSCPATDQRGVPRPQGPVCDIGAFEALESDLSIQKTDSPEPVFLGSDLTYTLKITNNGPNPAEGVVVTDVLPASVTFVSATPDQGSCSEAGGIVTCDLGDIAIGGMVNVSIVVRPNAVGTISNTASVTAAVSDPNTANNSVTESTMVIAAADLSVTKTDSPDPVLVGQNVTYSITVHNNGPSTATGVTVTDTLPAGVTFVSATPSQGSCSEAGGVVTCNIGNVADDANAFVTIVITANSPGMITNMVSVTATEPDPDPGNNSDSESTTLNPSADLSVIKTDSPDPVTQGSNITYTVTVMNNGPSSATGVTLTDTLPAGTTFVSATPSQGSCSPPVAGVLTCNLGSLASGAPATVLLVVRADNTGAVIDTASVSANEADPNPANNSDSESTTVNPAADLSVTKTDSPDPVLVGQNVMYSITVHNNGPSTATGVTVTDTLPAGVTFVSATPSQGTCSEAGGVVTCNIGNVADDANAFVTIVMTANSTGTITNMVSVTATEPDPDPSNNSDSESTTVNPAADLSVSKTDSPDPVTQGNNITYTVTVMNNGPSGATGVTLTDTLPAGTTFVSATPSQGSCSPPVAGVLTCNLGSLASGAPATVLLVVRADNTGAVIDTASVSANEADPNPANNSDSESTTVNPAADLAVTKTDSPDPVIRGRSLTYLVRVTNNGPSTATGVTLTDTLPAGVTFVSATPSQGSCTQAAGVVTCNLGNIAFSANATTTIVVTPNIVGMITNTANAAANEPDPTLGNNSAMATTRVVAPPVIVTGRDKGSTPLVRVFEAATGLLNFEITAYAATFKGGVRVATGDVTGDGIPDIVTGPGGGTVPGGAMVKVFNGATGSATPILMFSPYGDAFKGGIFVAAGDVNGDGTADIITGPGKGALEVRVFNGTTGTQLPAPVGNFFAYEPTFKGGVTVASADVNGDGRFDIITGPAKSRASDVRIFSGLDASLLNSFSASTATKGLFVAAGDVNGDGRVDVITGPGKGLTLDVRAFDALLGTEIQSLVAYEATFKGGVRVGAVDVDADGRDDILTGPGSAREPLVKRFDGLSASQLDDFLAYEATFKKGIFIAGGGGQ